MAKKKGPEMYEGKPVLVAANSDKLDAAVEKFRADYPDIPLEAPYVVRVKGKKIKDKAFKDNTAVGVVILHENVEVLEDFVFSGCTGLTNIKVDPANPIYDSREGCNAIIETEMNTLIAGCKNTVIPGSVTKIGYSAFEGCTGLTSLTFPASVTEIGVYAFKHCTGLTSIIIPNSVTEIGLNAFYYCTSLTNIKVDSANPIYDSREDCNAIIKTKTNTLITGCQNTVIPGSVTKIGYSAFEGCTGLTSITIPDSVTKIERGAFDGCTGLTSIKVEPANSIYDSRGDCNAIIKTESNTLVMGCQSTVIPDTVTKIEHNAFSGCSGLTSIIIPASVTEIGNTTFGDRTGITSIKVDPANPKYDSRGDCNAIIDTFFNSLRFGCQSTVIPDTVTRIESGAFSYCTSLTSIIIPNSVRYIGEGAFMGCTGLTSITIPDSVMIRSRAFDGCTNLNTNANNLNNLFSPIPYKYDKSQLRKLEENSEWLEEDMISLMGSVKKEDWTPYDEVGDHGDGLYVSDFDSYLYTVVLNGEVVLSFS